MRTIDEVALHDLLPPSIGGDKSVSDAAHSLDPHLRAIAGIVDNSLIYANIDRLSHAALDALAVQYDQTNWNEEWNLNTKISVLKDCIRNKRKAGTLKAVREAVQALGNDTQIIEWFQTTLKGLPHTFTVNVMFGKGNPSITKEVRQALDLAKPLRSHYEFIIEDENRFSIIPVAVMTPIIYDRAITQVKIKE